MSPSGTTRVDGWYRAVSSRAAFAFRIEDGFVVEVAPYGRRWLMGLTYAAAVEKLWHRNFTLESLR